MDIVIFPHHPILQYVEHSIVKCINLVSLKLNLKDKKWLKMCCKDLFNYSLLDNCLLVCLAIKHQHYKWELHNIKMIYKAAIRLSFYMYCNLCNRHVIYNTIILSMITSGQIDLGNESLFKRRPSYFDNPVSI